MVDLSKTDTVIFDLGEVIVDLDPVGVISALSKYTDIDPSLNMKELIVNSPLLIQYETGKMPEDQFLEGMNKLLGASMTQEQFETAWNKMLKTIPNRRLELMQELSKSFQTMILSNTNAMHQRQFDRMVNEQTGHPGMRHFVSVAHYSHHIGQRKPEIACYEYVIDHGSLNAERTLFLDDNPQNIEAAKKMGINAVRVEYPDQIFEILGYEQGE